MIKGYRTKTEWIYDQLRQMIQSGELTAGSRLPLAPLAEQFGTSEIPVREALRMLQRDGLIRIESHRGATVATVSWEELYEAIYVRTVLEVLAIRDAAPHHEAGTIAGLRELLAKMDELMKSPAPQSADSFSAANREFHRALYEPAPNALLRSLIQELWDRVWQTRSQSLFYLERKQMQRAHKEHIAMVDAVERHDAEAAAARATVHREGNLAAWRRLIQNATGISDISPDV